MIAPYLGVVEHSIHQDVMLGLLQMLEIGL